MWAELIAWCLGVIGLVCIAVFVVTDNRDYRREVARANAEGRGWKVIECPDEVEP